VELAKQLSQPILLHCWQRGDIYRVFLLDIDVYAPSLQSYFETVPKKWINDFLYGSAELEEVIQDFTPLIESHGSASNNSDKTKQGHLWIGFSNADKEDIYKLAQVQPQQSVCLGNLYS
jgi:hypothetical protein